MAAMSRTTSRALVISAMALAMIIGALLPELIGRNATRTEFVPAAPTGSISPIKTTYSGTGTFRVPGQFAAGIYIVTAGAGDFGCYWERLKALDGQDASVLSHGDASRGAYGRLVVTAKDRAVRMVGDCVWVKL